MQNPQRSQESEPYDLVVSHQSDDKSWVDCLARNLRARGYRVLTTPNKEEAERFAGELIWWAILEQPRTGSVVATAAAVESGWARAEYEAMLTQRQLDPEFTVVPLVVGDGAEPPFLDDVFVDFRDPSASAYRQAFYDLSCRLENQAPQPGATEEGELELPEPISASSALALTVEKQRFLDRVFDTLAAPPPLMLLAQADAGQQEMIEDIKTRAAASYGKANTLHLTPPWSGAAEEDQYFARLGRQCGFREEIRSTADWDDALDLRLSRGERLFVVVSRFENGSGAGRRQLAGVLRSLGERHGQALRVVLGGGEKLVQLKYEAGELSLLSHAEVLHWPEPTAADVLGWQQSDFPDVELDEAAARELLATCGGHPRLVRHCLQQRRLRPPAARTPDADLEALRAYDFVWELFTPYREDAAARDQICLWLERDDLGPAEPWPANRLLRRLYWSNLLVDRNGRLAWRCKPLREVGRQVLACGSSSAR